jgi:holdfast attachment protein HfaA
MTRTRTIGLAAALAAMSCGGAAAAQSIDANSASFNAGWGNSPGAGNRGVVLRNGRDDNGNRLIVDGVMQTGADQSSYARSDTGGAYDGGSGAGYGGNNTAIGNNLLVSVNGSWNTVVVDSTQINNGDVVAGRSGGELNGGLDFND